VTCTPIDPGLFSGEAAPALIGGRHRESGRIVFPCPVGNADFEPHPLPRTGSLWSYTVQRFAPKSPPFADSNAFEPFALGYVELPGALIVESRLIDVAFDELRVGLPMELAIVPFCKRADGVTTTIFAFRPCRERGS
jgi:uncharacterized OB-fold protein